MLKEKLEEHTIKLQGTVEELGRKNYYLEQEDRVLKELVRNYEGWYRILKNFALIIFILGKLIVKLYLLVFLMAFDVYVTFFKILIKFLKFHMGSMIG